MKNDINEDTNATTAKNIEDNKIQKPNDELTLDNPRRLEIKFLLERKNEAARRVITETKNPILAPTNRDFEVQ